MALRLTGTPTTSPRPLSAAELTAQAAGPLALGDWTRFGALFERVTEIDEPFDRLGARITLIEQGLATSRSAGAASATGLFVVLAQALTGILAEEPREPLLLNYAGVVFYELWSLEAARDLFRAAKRLDPELPHLDRNLSEVGRRLRTRRPRPLHAALPDLSRRIRQAARQAQPATGLTLSLCMIVRDEEEMLPRCLASAAPAVDEIVIVDTGSTDRTIEIARSFGARVIERPWTGSFAEARNASLEAATGDWLIYLDADEVLVDGDGERLRALLGQVWHEAFYMLETSYTGEEGDGTSMVHPALRLFRNRPNYRFSGRMHEQFSRTLPTHVPGRIAHSSVRIEHFGYLGSVRDAKEKSRRNIELLEAQQADGATGGFLHFNLGTEYSIVGDTARALHHLQESWRLVQQGGEQARDYVPTLIVRLATALRAAGRPQESVTLCEEGVTLLPGFTDLVFTKGLALAELGRPDEALAAWEQCLELGDAPARYGAVVGAGSYLPLISIATLHRRRGETAAARALLERCASENPGFPGVVSPLADALLADGVAPEAVVGEIEARLADPGANARFMLARALHEHGALEQAEHQYALVLDARPANTHVRVTLAELLLHAGRYAEAGALSEPVSEEDPFAAQAARIALWATVAGGELSGLPAAEDRARRRGVTEVELDVFARWAALRGAPTPTGPLAVGGTPWLAVILEHLLGRHEIADFEALLPALTGSDLPEREQRELLARMYLRFGLLQAAAREWMAVCQTAPDARAMTGLARVAAAHGLPQDALTFAGQACLLDPTSTEAQQLRVALVGQAEPAGLAA